MKTKDTQDILDLDQRYERFLQSVTLTALGINSCSCDLDRQHYLSQFRSKSQRPTRRLKQQGKVTEIGPNYFDAEVAFNVTCSSEDKQKSKALLTIKFVLEAHFHAESPSPEYAQKFATSQLLTILLPYARHFVTNITNEMSIPPLFLPLAVKQERAVHNPSRTPIQFTAEP